MGNLQVKELGPRIQSDLPSRPLQRVRVDLQPSDSHFRPPPPGAPGSRGASSAAGAGGGGGGGWGVGVWLPVGAPAPPAARVRSELRRKRWRPREGGSRQTPAQSLDTLGFGGGGAPATPSMDPVAGTFLRMLFLLSAQPWSTLAAGNTCEYGTSFKTYADNLEFVLLQNNNN